MRRLIIMVVAALALAMVGAGSVGANSGNTVRTIGKEIFKPNELVAATFRFAPEVIKVRSGERIRFVDRDQDEDEPHTATIVNKADLPSNFDELEACFGDPASPGPCGAALAAHFAKGEEQPPTDLVVNKGKRGLDTVGDSLLFGGNLDNQSISARVTAARGTTLDYLCAIHPWMQGKIKVR
jgi:plastocyanin